MIDIISLNLEELQKSFAETFPNEKPNFRAKQVFDWLHGKKTLDFEMMTNISLAMRISIAEKYYMSPLRVLNKLESKYDSTAKYLYGLSDGTCVETVVMKYDHGYSICVSTQAGCKMGCGFCASAKAGFERNLTPSEMLLQIYQSEADLPSDGKSESPRISNLVLMGIGEPLDNFDNVLKFLELANLNISMRNISLSTCGLVPGIYELAKQKLALTLSVSLHAPTQPQRLEIMPIAKRYDINELIRACKDYFSATKRRISFEYAIIDGFNNSVKDAQNLARLVRGINCHINLIPINTVKETKFRATENSAKIFKGLLEKNGLNVTIRRTLGADIEAACGQLRATATAIEN